MKLGKLWISAAIFGCLLSLQTPTQAASLWDDEDRMTEAEKLRAKIQARQAQRLKATACPDSVKNSKIAVLVYEAAPGGRMKPVSDPRYAVLFEPINDRLRGEGFQTFSQEEIQRQIEQAFEIAAAVDEGDLYELEDKMYMMHGARFVMKTEISSRSQMNPMIRVRDVFVNLSFDVVDGAGQSVSRFRAKGDAFSGNDTLGAALDIIRGKAGSLVTRLRHDLCTSAL